MTQSQSVTRRQFLKLSVVSAFGTTLAACGAPTPQPVSRQYRRSSHHRRTGSQI